jgi:hypothetical protein
MRRTFDFPLDFLRPFFSRSSACREPAIAGRIRGLFHKRRFFFQAIRSVGGEDDLRLVVSVMKIAVVRLSFRPIKRKTDVFGVALDKLLHPRRRPPLQ